MAKQIIGGFKKEEGSKRARQKLIQGARVVSDAVVITLGPKGRNVALDKSFGAPNIVHDGYTVAKDIELEDPFENMGAQLIKEAALKTNDTAGDGTTTSSLLAMSILTIGWEAVTAGADPMSMKKEIDVAVEKVISEIKQISKSIKGKKKISQVATISANDEKVGEIISEAIDKVGENGVITVEEGKGLDLSIDYKKGMEFDKGYASPYFVTDPDKMESEIENPLILITDQKISAIADLLPFLESAVKTTKNIVLIADEIEGEALATLVVNKLRGSFNLLAIKAPGFGDRRKDILEDIAIVTGGSVISEDTGRKLDSITVEDCGRAEKVWADKDNCQIIGGKGSKKAINARIASIKRAINHTDSDFDKEKLQERLAKLSGGVAVINVGAATEIEMNEKKERVKDAVEATKAAIEEGVVPGGGVALFNSRKILLKDISESYDRTKGQRPVWRDFNNAGSGVVYAALEKPLVFLAENAKADSGLVLREIESKNNSNYGFNVKTMDYGDMFVQGVLDPAKVVRLALQNAASVAGMILTTECLITDIPEKKEDKSPAGGMPPMGGMGM